MRISSWRHAPVDVVAIGPTSVNYVNFENDLRKPLPYRGIPAEV